MKLWAKITAYAAIMFIILITVMYWIILINNNILLDNIGNQAATSANGLILQIDGEIDTRMEDVSFHGQSLALTKEIIHSNNEFDNLTDVQTYINQQDQIWISSKEDELTPFMSEILQNEGSKRLKQIQEFYKIDRNYNVYAEIFATNKYGVIVSMTGKTSDYRQDDELWWQKAKLEGMYTEEPSYDESSKTWGIVIASKIVDENGEFIGVIKEVLNFEEFEYIIENSQEYLNNNNIKPEVKIIDNTGKVIHQSKNTPYKLESISDYSLFKNMNDITGYIVGEEEWEEGEKEEAIFAYSTSKGFHHFKGFGWKVLIEYDKEKLFAEADSLKTKSLLYSTLLGVLLLFGCFFITNSFVKQIKYLKDTTAEIGKGNLNAGVSISSKDEIGDMARSIDEMRLGLKDRNDLLNSLLATLKGKFGNLATILVRKDIQELVKRNPRIKKILPKSLGTVVEKGKKFQRHN